MLLNNRYKIIQTLESGGCGETFLAEDTHMPSRRRCVIKQLKPSTDDPFAYEIIKERFQSEAEILENIGRASDQIPHLHAYFTENREFYLVQDFIEGKNLKRKVFEEGLFGEGDARKFLTSLLNVLIYLHSQGIIHRDIKPENIMIRASDGVPVLIDFGAVKEVVTMVSSEGTLTKSIVIGSPGYMPPEQALGFPVFSSDLYSLGKTTIFALTGKSPRELDQMERNGQHWRLFAPMVSPDLAAVLDKATKPADTDRYQSAQEMLATLELNNTIATHPTIVPDPWRSGALAEPHKKSSVIPYILAAVFALAFVITLVIAIKTNSSKKSLASQLSQEQSARQAAESKIRDLESKVSAAEDKANKAKGEATDIQEAIREGKVYRVAQVNNRTKNDINYEILQSDGSWKEVTIKPGETYQHWRRNADVVVKFDYSFSEGFQERRYTLKTTNIYGHEPTQPEEDSSELYYFSLDSSNNIDLNH